MGLQEMMGLMAHQVYQVNQDQLVQMVVVEMMVPMELQDCQVNQVQMGLMVVQV